MGVVLYANSSLPFVVITLSTAKRTNVWCHSVQTSSRNCANKIWLNGECLNLFLILKIILINFSFLRLQEQQFNRRRAAAMNRTMQAMTQSSTSVSSQITPGGSKEEMSPGSISPAQPMGGMGSPHHAGIGMKPGTQKPPAAVLQVVKQVRR